MPSAFNVCRRTVALLLVALIAIPLAGGPAARALNLAAPDSAPVPVSPHSANDETPWLLRRSDGRLMLLWSSSRAGNADIWYAEAPHSQGEWSAPVRLTTAPWEEGDPAAAELPDGRLMAVWTAKQDGNADLRMAVREGGMWSAPATLFPHPLEDGAPALAQADDGSTWLVWQSFRNGNPDIWASRTVDAGAHWSEPIQITTSTGRDETPTVAQAADGRLWVAWRTANYIWTCQSQDAGLHWTEPAALTFYPNYGAGPFLAAGQDGRLWLAWHSYRAGNQDLWIMRSEDNGQTWGPSQAYTHFLGYDVAPAAAALDDGHLALAWTSDRLGQNDIWFGELGVLEDTAPPPYVHTLEQDPPVAPQPDEWVTIRACAVDEEALTSIRLIWTKNGLPQASVPLFDDGIHGDRAAGDNWYGGRIGPFPAGSLVSYQIKAVDVDGSSVVVPLEPVTFQVEERFPRQADILLVADMDPSISWILGYYTSALDALGYTYDVWDFSQMGSLDADTLLQYREGAVIWAVPFWGQICDAATQGALQAYLQGGGNLFVSGQDVSYHLRSSGVALLEEYLHARHVANNTGLYTLVGRAGDPIADGLTLRIAGGDGANDQFQPDEVDPLSPGTTMLTYAGQGSAPPAALLNPWALGLPGYEGPVLTELGPEGTWSSGSAAVRVKTPIYKVVFFAFGFEAIDSAADRQLVMGRVLEWFALSPPLSPTPTPTATLTPVPTKTATPTATPPGSPSPTPTATVRAHTGDQHAYIPLVTTRF